MVWRLLIYSFIFQYNHLCWTVACSTTQNYWHFVFMPLKWKWTQNACNWQQIGNGVSYWMFSRENMILYIFTISFYDRIGMQKVAKKQVVWNKQHQQNCDSMTRTIPFFTTLSFILAYTHAAPLRFYEDQCSEKSWRHATSIFVWISCFTTTNEIIW